MPYANKQIEIPLCKTCAEAYVPTKDAVIKIIGYAKQCLAHYVDLDTIQCLKKKSQGSDAPPDEPMLNKSATSEGRRSKARKRDG